MSVQHKMLGNMLQMAVRGASTVQLANPISLCRSFSTSQSLLEVQKLTRMRVVDNSAIGKAAAAAGRPAKIIQVYNKSGVGRLGDKVLVAIKGQKKRAFIVGLKQKQKTLVPRFDTNNIVLIEDNGNPTGTRIRVPVPSCLRGKGDEFTKILALASRFV